MFLDSGCPNQDDPSDTSVCYPCISSSGGWQKKSVLTVKITTDYYYWETSFEVKNQNGDQVMQGSGYTDRYKEYTVSESLPSGTYEFIIMDTIGDGFSSGGKYELIVDGALKISGSGNFGYSKAKAFDI